MTGTSHACQIHITAKGTVWKNTINNSNTVHELKQKELRSSGLLRSE